MSEKLKNITNTDSVDNSALFYAVDLTRTKGDQDVSITKEDLKIDLGIITPESTQTADTGSTIPLDNIFGHFCNLQSANSNTSYTINSSNIVGSYAIVLINASTEPTVTGATQKGGVDFIADTDLELLVQNRGDAGIVYSYMPVSVGGSEVFNIIRNVNDLDSLISSSTKGKYIFINDITLDGNKTLPSDVELVFDGAVVSGGGFTLTGTHTTINSEPKQIFDTNISFGGNWNVRETYPEWFGGVADGSTDITPSAEKAINSTLSKKILFTGDSYYAESNIDISNIDNLIIKSDNASITIDETTVTDLFRMDTCNNITIDGFIADLKTNLSASYTPNFSRAIDCNDIKIINNDIKDAKYGIITSESVNSSSDNFVLDNNKFYGTLDFSSGQAFVSGILCYGFGVCNNFEITNNYNYQTDHLVLGSKFTYLLVEGNNIENSIDSAIYTDGTNLVINNNRLSYCGKDGIKITTSGTIDNTSNIVSNNIIYYPGFVKTDSGSAISIMSRDTSVFGNKIYLDRNISAYNGQVGVISQETATENIKIYDNEIYCTGNCIGMSILKGDNISIEDNFLISGTEGRAIGINNDPSETITNVFIKGNKINGFANGILMTSSTSNGSVDSVIVNQNEFSDTGSGNALATSTTGFDVTNCVIYGNTFKNLTGFCIRGHKFQKDTIIEDNFYDGSSFGRFYRDGNATVRNMASYNTYTFATLPVAVEGIRAIITDGNSPTYRGVASGGGTDKVEVLYDGTNWIYN